MATNYSATVWPGMVLPPVAATTKNGGTAEAPDAPPQVVPAPTATQAVDFDPVAAANAVKATSYVRPPVTEQQIRSEFGIVLGSDVVTNPYPPA